MNRLLTSYERADYCPPIELFRSNHLVTEYAKIAYANETNIVMSPVPLLATGPTHSVCDMQTTIIGMDVKKVKRAA